MNLQIDDEVYKLKTDDLTIEEFMTVLSYDLNLKMNWPKLISLFYSAPFDKVVLMPQETQELGIMLIFGLIEGMKKTIPKNFKIELNDLTLGDFVNIDIYLAEGLHKNLRNIIDILFDIDEDEKISDYWMGVQSYFLWRQNVFINYKNLFKVEESDEDDTSDKTHTDVARSWYKSIAFIVDDDFLKMEEVYNRKVFEVLNFMAYKKQKLMDDLHRNNTEN